MAEVETGLGERGSGFGKGCGKSQAAQPKLEAESPKPDPRYPIP
jgi:hypothetical protein